MDYFTLYPFVTESLHFHCFCSYDLHNSKLSLSNTMISTTSKKSHLAMLISQRDSLFLQMWVHPISDKSKPSHSPQGCWDQHKHKHQHQHQHQKIWHLNLESGKFDLWLVIWRWLFKTHSHLSFQSITNNCFWIMQNYQQLDG